MTTIANHERQHIAETSSPLIRLSGFVASATSFDDLVGGLLGDLSGALPHARLGLLILGSTQPPYLPALAAYGIGLVTEAALPGSIAAILDAHVGGQVAVDDLAAVGRLIGDPQIASAFAAPLVAQRKAVGVLIAASSLPAEICGVDVELLDAYAGMLALAAAALRQQELARRRAQELATLNQIAATITSTLDTREVYRLVVQQLRSYFNVEAGSLLLQNDGTGDLEFVMTIEGGEEKLAGVRVPAGQGIVGVVAARQSWLIVDDALNDPRIYQQVGEQTGFVTRSILCAPMLLTGRVIGVVELLNKLDGAFTEDEAERLQRMAAFIGVAIENARLFQQISGGRDRLAAILDSTADGIVMAGTDDVVQIANLRAAAICGRAMSALVGRPIDAVAGEIIGRAHEVARRPDAMGDLSVTELTLSGHPRVVRLFELPVRDASGATYGRLLILRDVSQERELEELRDDYTSMLVHDLRAPLTSIMNGVSMVRRGIGGPLAPTQEKLLSIAADGSQTLLDLVNTLLDIAKMEQGHVIIERQRVDLHAIVGRVFDRLNASAAGQKIALERVLPDDLPPIYVDGEKLQRVFLNLIDNAIKFSPLGSAVTLGAAVLPSAAALPLREISREARGLLCWVHDRGRGIPRAYRERIFEKFGQVRGTNVRGTGLGLAFCRLVTEAHNGIIWVESEEGSGSIFGILLPETTFRDERR